MKSVLLFIASILLALSSVWFFLWMVASQSLAFTYCDEFSLFHESFRCRQPHLALIGLVITAILSITCLRYAFKSANHAKNT